jgi:excisionase family DNA binding protein
LITDDDFTDEQLLLTTVQAAKVLAVGRTKIYDLIKHGELRPVHISRSCRISWAELERYVARLENSSHAGTDPTAGRTHRRWRRVLTDDGRSRVFPVDALEHGDASA